MLIGHQILRHAKVACITLPCQWSPNCQTLLDLASCYANSPSPQKKIWLNFSYRVQDACVGQACACECALLAIGPNLPQKIVLRIQKGWNTMHIATRSLKEELKNAMKFMERKMMCQQNIPFLLIPLLYRGTHYERGKYNTVQTYQELCAYKRCLLKEVCGMLVKVQVFQQSIYHQIYTVSDLNAKRVFIQSTVDQLQGQYWDGSRFDSRQLLGDRRQWVVAPIAGIFSSLKLAWCQTWSPSGALEIYLFVPHCQHLFIASFNQFFFISLFCQILFILVCWLQFNSLSNAVFIIC